MTEPKLTKEQREEIGRRYVAGETRKALAAEFRVCPATIVRYTRHLSRPHLSRSTSGDVEEFASRARAILKRQDPGTDKRTYDEWYARVKLLQTKAGGSLTRNQAIVKASKHYECLFRLFRSYDLRDFDPDRDSHPVITHIMDQAKKQKDGVVEIEGRELPYRDALNWAMSAAGEFLRTGADPVTCPCNSAWFLYTQAKDSPKDFLSRIGQVESKVDAGEAERARKDGAKSVSEIDAMLAELDC